MLVTLLTHSHPFTSDLHLPITWYTPLFPKMLLAIVPLLQFVVQKYGFMGDDPDVTWSEEIPFWSSFIWPQIV